MAGSHLLVLNADDLKQIIEPHAVIAAVREAFELHSSAEGDSYPVVREALGQGPAPAVFGIKSGAIESQRLVGLKAAGFWRHNRNLGMPAPSHHRAHRLPHRPRASPARWQRDHHRSHRRCRLLGH